MSSRFLQSSCGRTALVCIVLLLSTIARGDPFATAAGAKSKDGPVPPTGISGRIGKSVPHAPKATPCDCRDSRGQDPGSSQHFVEVEVVLDGRVTLKSLRALPHAPGGAAKLLPDGDRALAQLPAQVVGNLMEKGADVTIRREFFLMSKSKQLASRAPLSVASGVPAEDSVEGRNDTDCVIPFGESTYSEITITTAPAGAEVTSLDVFYEIVHPEALNLAVSLTDENYTSECSLPAEHGAAGGRIAETVTGITSFPGEKANQIWTLWAEDLGSSGSRYIDTWWIKVYYAACPAKTCGSGTSVTGTSETNRSIPLGTWMYSEIDVTGAPPGSYVSCVDVHYEIKHPYVGDLVVDLSDDDVSREYHLWAREGEGRDDLDETVTGIRTFANENPNQAWTLWVTDESWGDSGYLDRWWIKVYYQGSRVTAPHDWCSNAIPVADGVAYSGSSAGATGLMESLCGWGDFLDVWHIYRPDHSGLVTFTLGCTDFDTTLSVFDRCAGVELACADDTCDSRNAEVTMPVSAGEDYLLRVAGYEEQVGAYTLRTHQAPHILPEPPALPNPVHEAAGVEVNVTLSWNSAVPFTPSFPAARAGGIAAQGIYGRDDRTEEYEVTDPALLAAGDATVMLLDWSDLSLNADGTYSLPLETFAERYERTDWEGNPLCPDEPFRDQPAPGWCTGVLVAPDLIATAGHCPACETPNSIAAVFGFVMLDELTPATRIEANDVYLCTEVVALQSGTPDWALVRLDRTAANHLPLRLRRDGKVADHQPLAVIGYPWGVPRKYDWGATVRENAAVIYFQANCDTYEASSGGPVLNRDTLEIEGLLVAGNPDFVFDEDAGCDRSAVYPDTGHDDSWEDVVRATVFSAAVPSFDVYLGTNPQQLQLKQRDVVVPWLAVDSLDPATVYYWQVVAKNAGGETRGPVWSFTTGPR